MRQPLVIGVGFAAVLAAVVAAQDGSPANLSGRRAAADASTALSFEPNHGQFDAEVRFASRGRGYTLFITDREAVVALRSSTVRLALAGAAPRSPIGLERQPGIVNYLIGNDPAKWRTHIPTFSRVNYDDVYPGIDLVYYGRGNAHEYDLVVAPGVDPSRISMQVTGADEVSLDAAGHLQLATADGALTMRAPNVYQTIDGERQTVDARYVLTGSGAVSFAIGEYQRDAALVIDPELIYGTFLGGSGNGVDQLHAVALDATGAPYIVGSTDTADFPTQAPIQSQRRGSNDAVITKLTPDGLQRVYATYLGGTGFDGGADIDVRADGVAYVLGSTSSTDFPVRDAFQTERRGSSDAFVVELARDGASIVRGTLLGGGDVDTPKGIELARHADPRPPAGDEPPPLVNAFDDIVFVFGSTTSPDFPTVDPARATRAGERDGFVTAFDRQTLRPVYSTYVGRGGGANTADSLVLNRVKGDLYLLLQRGDDEAGPLLAHFKRRASATAGRVRAQAVGLSLDLAETAFLAGFRERARDQEALRQQAKEAASLQPCKEETARSLEFSRQIFLQQAKASCKAFADQLRGRSRGQLGAAAVSDEVLERTAFVSVMPGCLPVGSATTCTERATLGLFDDDARLIEHVNFGGTRAGREFIPLRIVAGTDGKLHMIGRTSDTTLPVVNPVQGNNAGSGEGFVLTLDLASGATTFLSYLGGRTFDILNDIALDQQGNRWIVGDTQSADFPVTRSGVQPEIRGRTDGFVVKITP